MQTSLLSLQTLTLQMLDNELDQAKVMQYLCLFVHVFGRLMELEPLVYELETK